MELPLVTTTLGAFPKPNYVPVRDWFDLARQTGGMNTAETTRQYSADIEKNKNKHEELFIRAAKEVLDIQVRAGVLIPCHSAAADGTRRVGWSKLPPQFRGRGYRRCSGQVEDATD